MYYANYPGRRTTKRRRKRDVPADTFGAGATEFGLLFGMIAILTVVPLVQIGSHATAELPELRPKSPMVQPQSEETTSTDRASDAPSSRPRR